nr:hypothetical protein [Tanacetum cinerariifolium]
MNYEPIVAGTQSNGFVGTKASDNAGQARKETKPIKDYILLPLWTADLPFSQDPKSSYDDGSKPSSNNGKKVDEDPRKNNECRDQKKENNVNNTNNVNTIILTVNVAGTNEKNKLLFDPNMPALEDVSTFNFLSDDEDDGTMADMNNLDTTNFVLYQMDVKNDFLYEKVEEEAYVCQPLRFEDPYFPDRVYKVEKALYGLHQAPRAWKELCNAFERLMHEKFQMSSMVELTFFLGLQVKQKKDGIFISQDKYVSEILKKFRFTKFKIASTPMETQKPLLKNEDGEEVDVHIYRYLKGQLKLSLWYPKYFLFDLVAYTNSDYAGASLDMKYTIGGCQLLGCILITWQFKKQTIVANSTIEAEYVAASSCCGKCFGFKINYLIMGNTLQSDEDRMKLNELLELCSNFQNMVLELEKAKTSQHNEIASLKRRVKNLEKRHRGIKVIDTDEDITLINDQDDADKDMFDVNVLGGKEVFVAAGQTENVVNITTEELTLAQALEALKTSKPKVKGLVVQELRESTTTTISSQQSPDKEARLAREKAVKEQEANIALLEKWNDIQAKIDVDHQLAE